MEQTQHYFNRVHTARLDNNVTSHATRYLLRLSRQRDRFTTSHEGDLASVVHFLFTFPEEAEHPTDRSETSSPTQPKCECDSNLSFPPVTHP